MSNVRIQWDQVIGVDPSKKWFDASFKSDGEKVRYDRTVAQIAEFVKRVAALPGRTVVVLEATGGLQKIIAKALHEARIPYAVVNPRQIRDFAKAAGQLAKTDQLDAQIIALFGERMDLKLAELPRPAEEQLQLLTRRRKDLVAMIVEEKNRRSSCEDQMLTRQIESHLKWMEKQKEKLEKQIGQGIKDDPELKAKKELLESMPGVAETTAAILLGEMPELGKLNRKQVAKLAGLAPLNDDSGLHHGRAYIRGGRQAVRNALYMSAMVAVQRDRYFEDFHDRLVKAGKKPIVALVAVMRKMLTILNALVRDGRKFSSTAPSSAQKKA